MCMYIYIYIYCDIVIYIYIYIYVHGLCHKNLRPTAHTGGHNTAPLCMYSEGPSKKVLNHPTE